MLVCAIFQLLYRSATITEDVATSVTEDVATGITEDVATGTGIRMHIGKRLND